MILIHERVEELAKQADEYLLENVQEENRSSWAQVFAELILEEVMQTLFITGHESAVDTLNKHFGVEE